MEKKLQHSSRCVFDCCLSEVKSVTDDLGAERESPRSSAHSETRAACSVRAEAATLKSVWEEASVKSSA